MKKNKMLFLGLITVFVAVLSLSLVSGTYAKYTSTVTGTDNAQVAKWAWVVEEANVPATNTFTFDLFNTIKDTGGVDETHVVAGKVAPGTTGSFELNVTNNSEVAGKLSIVLAISHNGSDSSDPSVATYQPIQYTISDSEPAFAAGESKAITFNWAWAFESAHDELDTKLGQLAPTFTATVTLTFVQVD